MPASQCKMARNKVDTRLMPQNFSHYFSRACTRRSPNVMKEYYRFLRVPGMGSLAGGSPYPGYFPFEKIEVSLLSPEHLNSGNTARLTVPLANPKDLLRLEIERTTKSSHPSHRIDLDTGLQYGIASGYAPLYAWLKRLVTTVYHPNIPYKGGPDIMISGGSADGLAKVYDIVFNMWDEDVHNISDREGLLVEEFVYPPALAQIRPKNVNIVPVKMDAQGALAEGEGGLLEVLESWDFTMGKRPHVLYLVPTGQNPTSSVLSYERRRQIYQVCSQFDVIIIEDDPYWSLYYSPQPSHGQPDAHVPDSLLNGAHTEETMQNCKSNSKKYRFLNELVPSFLQFDTDGRVIRLDTFSKTIAPGCRLGYITAQPSICEELFRVTDGTTQQPSGFVQAIVAKMIAGLDGSVEDSPTVNKGDQPKVIWGFDGWINWLESLRDKYQQRMITMATIFGQNRFKKSKTEEFLEMFTFTWPRAGMFIWVKVNIHIHPLASQVDLKRLMLALWVFCTQEPFRIIMVPGKDFAANDQIRDEKAYLYLRFCFAAVDEDILVSKSEAFTDACAAFWDLYSVEDIDQVLAEEDRLTALANGLQDEVDTERMTLEDC